MRVLGVTFCQWIFLFSRSNAADANIGIFVQFVKHPIECVCSAIFHHIIIMCLQCHFPSHNNNFLLTNVYSGNLLSLINFCQHKFHPQIGVSK